MKRDRSAKRRERGGVRVVGAPGTDAGNVRARHWWDAETGILSTRLPGIAAGAPGECVHVVGDDGSWLSLDLVGGRVRGVEVAVWPRVRVMRGLEPPGASGAARLELSSSDGAAEVCGTVGGYAGAGGSCFRFKVGSEPAAAVWRSGRDVLLEATADGRLAGVWLLNVPPSPEHRDHDDRPH